MGRGVGGVEDAVVNSHACVCDYVMTRQLEDLHRWLRLARLVALSHGHDSVTKAAWDHMLALEAQRLERSHLA